MRLSLPPPPPPPHRQSRPSHQHACHLRHARYSPTPWHSKTSSETCWHPRSPPSRPLRCLRPLLRPGQGDGDGEGSPHGPLRTTPSGAVLPEGRALSQADGRRNAPVRGMSAENSPTRGDRRTKDRLTRNWIMSSVGTKRFGHFWHSAGGSAGEGV